MITLSFKVEKDHLIRLDKEKITDKTRNYILLSFSSFSEDWDDLNVFLILQDEKKNNYLFDLNEEEPTVTVPEVVLRGGLFKVSVVGFNEDTRITTNRRTIPLFPSGYTTDIQPVEPGDYSTDVFEDFILIGAETVEGEVKDWIPSQLDVTEQVPAEEGYGKTYIVTFSGEQVGVKINTPLGGGGGGVDIVTRWNNNPVDYRVPSEKLVKSSLDLKLNSSDAFSGSYNDLSNKPSIPSSSSDLSDGSDLVKKSDVVDNLTSTSATAPLSAKQGKVLNDLIGNAIQYING